MKKKKKTVSESEFLNIVDIIAKKLAYKFKFGYHSYEDMKQQISIFALEGMENYDHKRPLENFLWTHVRNRLFNYKRDNYQRPSKPCLTCPLYDKSKPSECSKYSNKNDCELYDSWTNRNNAKKNLMHLTTINETKDYSYIFCSDNDPVDSIDNKEIILLIEKHLTGEDRVTYLKIKNGSKVNKADTTKLIQTIQQILKNHA